MSEKKEFTCPECGNHRLEEVMANVTVASEINEIFVEDGAADFNYGEQTNEDGEVERFQCIDCGYVLTDDDGDPITQVDELAEWLENHCP